MHEKSNDNFHKANPDSKLNRFLSLAVFKVVRFFESEDKVGLSFTRRERSFIVSTMLVETSRYHCSRLIEWIEFATNGKRPSFEDEYPNEIFDYAQSPEGRKTIDRWLLGLKGTLEIEELRAYMVDLDYFNHQFPTGDDIQIAFKAVDSLELACNELILRLGAGQ